MKLIVRKELNMNINYLKLALPMLLATGVANAELNFTKHLPMDKAMMQEHSFSTYDYRVDFGTNLFNAGAGVSYSHVKPDSKYIGVGTFIGPKAVGLTAIGGYNFLLTPDDILTPAAGMTFYSGKGQKFYPVVAVGYEHAFNDVFSIGADFSSVMNGDFNYTLGVPCTYHFGEQKRWNVRVTPTVIHAQLWFLPVNITTLGVSLGYRF
jgi:hypothetical protein